MTPKILALIPARGGSKGVPRKNIRDLGGKPLVVHSIDAALAVKDLLYRVIVSTDDAKIAEVARAAGAEAPFLRPDGLANDKAPMVPVEQHAVEFVEEQDGVKIDWILLLQPTTPFRSAEDIRHCVELAQESDCDAVISVAEIKAGHPIQAKKIVDGQLTYYCIEEIEGMRRQDCQPPAYLRNGAIYLTRRDVLMKNDSIWGKRTVPYIMPEERSVNIDRPIDFKVAEVMMQEMGKKA